MNLRERARQRLRDEIALVQPNPGGHLRIALAYPNTYAVGMSNLGVHTLYRLLNAVPQVRCERVFLPDPDELEAYARTGACLVALESQQPVAGFDVLAFSASFENDYPNILAMLELAGIPFRAADRDEHHPLVLMGGATVSINPEPVAPFLDVCCLGEGEELVAPLVAELLTQGPRQALLQRLAANPGFYVPSLYEPRYEAQGARPAAFAGMTAAEGAPTTITKVRAHLVGQERVAATAIFTPHTEFGDRVILEVARGCTKGCRYCWVGYSILPFRVHQVHDVLAVAELWRPHTDRIGLVATALLDHPDIEAIAEGLRERGFKVFSPSLIISTLREPLLRTVIESGQETITIAPEAGSDRMRRLIMKDISNEQILEKVRMIFRAGAVNLRNYVIIGLPGETDDDLRAIVDLARDMREIMLQECRQRGRIGTITLSINCLIPKPGTPLQWAEQLGTRAYRAKLRLLQRWVAEVPNVSIVAMPPRAAEIQAVMSRGDRRVADLLEEWHRLGSWRQALRRWTDAGNPGLEAHLQARAPGQAAPWDHLRIGPAEPALVNQWSKAMAVAAEPPVVGIAAR